MLAIAAGAGYVVAARHSDAALPWGSFGYVHLPTAVLLAIASTIAARHGVQLAHRLAHRSLSRAFGVLLLAVGIAMLIDLLN